MGQFVDHQSISAGYNNASDLLRLHLYERPHFSSYKRYIESEFTPYQSRETSGAGTFKRIGLPSCKWMFPALTSEEFQFFIEEFFEEGEDSVAVTIRTLDIEYDLWYNYNALLHRPELAKDNWNGYEYRDIVFEFTDLQRL